MRTTEHGGGVDPQRLLRLLGVAPEDAPALEQLMDAAAPAVDDRGRKRLAAELRTRMGHFPEHPPTADVDETTALAGMLDCTPDLLTHFASLGVEPAIVSATMADFGRHLAINRRVHGRFGMDTWKWLTNSYSGAMFQLGRLQYLLHRTPAALRDVTSLDWVVGVHIPESGPLRPDDVDESIGLARDFFAAHFPRQSIDTVTCESWMLDPYLTARLPSTANIRRFAERFSSFAEPVDAPEDAVYFTFHQRGLANLGRLPRTSSLQRVVLERMDDGGVWQLGSGWLRLPVGSTGADIAPALRR